MEINYLDKDKYDRDQLEQLKLGLEHGVDVSVYADTSYMALQMEWIRLGLEKGIDVSLYATPDFDWFQMEEIYKGITEKLDVSKYADASIPYDRMREIRKGLKQGIDLSPFGKYGASELRELRRALRSNVHIVKYMVDGYEAEQLEVIREALAENIDIDKYLQKEYRGIALHEILLGLRKNLDVKHYADISYSWQQMREIREGLEERLDIDKYSNCFYNASQMHEIRLGLEAGLDVTSYRSLMYTAKDMRRMRLALLDEITGGSGMPMVPGNNGYYEYLFDKDKTGDILFLSDGAVDFKNSFLYSVCKPNQVIAVYHKATEGKNGLTENGKVIKAAKGKEKRVLSGKGVCYNELEGTYTASYSGWVYLDETKDLLEIRQTEQIDEINASMGRVIKSGNLVVLGNIDSGSFLELDGDLIVDGHVENAHISCTGDIFIREGINGGGNALVKAGKSICCMYIENCDVTAASDIRADYILTSKVKAGGRITVRGSRGSVIGSQLTSHLGIICQKAGNEAGIPAKLSIVYPKSDNVDKKTLAEEKKKVCKELDILNEAKEKFKKRYSPEERNNNADFIKIEKAIYTKNLELKNIEEKAEEQEERIKMLRDSKIIVLEKIYEGVSFAIERGKYLSAGDKGKVVFELVNGKLNLIRE